MASVDVQTPTSLVLTSADRRPFEADIQRLLHLIIRSVYSNKDVFLRELVSNASDAIDKVRILKLNANESANITAYGIRVRLLPHPGGQGTHILEIEDDGVGMDEEDLIKNLSTIAHSGTHDFLQTMKETTSDVSQLIGQFGVGFYSSYLVASVVDVITRKWNTDRVLRWSSDGASGYEISEYDGDDFDLLHGTRIRLYLKDEEDKEYGSTNRVQTIIKQHTQFISYPIQLWVEKEKEEEIPQEEEEQEVIEEEEGATSEGQGDVKVEEVAETDASTKEKTETKPKTRKVKYEEWEQINGDKPLWYRQPSEITDEEYVQLYQSLSAQNKYETPVYWKHFKAEGRHEFQGIFYFTPRSRMAMNSQYESPQNRNIRLYVKKVLIMEHCGKELIPEWMGFITGIVDSNDLQLNVSREMLQSDVVVKSMKKYIQKQVLKMLGDFFEKEREKYITFYKENHKYIKWGMTQGEKGLEDFLVFPHSKAEKEGEYISFQDYVDKYMVEGQKQIFYMTGDNLEEMKSSIFMEKFLEKGITVLYMDDPIDEFTMQAFHKYKEYDVVNISKDFDSDVLKEEGEGETKSAENADGGTDGDGEKSESEEGLTEKAFFEFVKATVGTNKVSEVKASRRLKDSPACVTANRYGWSGHMEKVMKSQPLQEKQMMMFSSLPKTMEVNMQHRIIKSLVQQFTTDKESEAFVANVKTLYNISLLQSGYTPDDANTFCKTLFGMLESTVSS